MPAILPAPRNEWTKYDGNSIYAESAGYRWTFLVPNLLSRVIPWREYMQEHLVYNKYRPKNTLSMESIKAAGIVIDDAPVPKYDWDNCPMIFPVTGGKALREALQ